MQPEGPPPETEYSPERWARDEAQLMLGQIHGIVWLAVNDVGKWLPMEPVAGSSEQPLTAEDILRAGDEVHTQFGVVQAALNTGVYDKSLAEVAMSGAQGQAKKKGLAYEIARLFVTPLQEGLEYVKRLRSGLRWGGTIIGSLSAALKKEIEQVPGAGAAAEAIKEFVELLLNATERSEGPPATTPPPKPAAAPAALRKTTKPDVE